MPPELPAVRILIVDDDKAICEYMQTLLERDGFQVKTLSDPTGVEEEVRHGGYHLIILDLMMPKLDGIEVLRRIRKLDTDIAVVIFTGFPNLESAVASMKLDAVDYIKKPFNVDEFREVISRVMRKKGLARTPEEQLHKRHRRHDPQPAQGEGPHPEADVAAHRPQRVAPLADRARRVERVDLVALQDRHRPRVAHPGPLRRVSDPRSPREASVPRVRLHRGSRCLGSMRRESAAARPATRPRRPARADRFLVRRGTVALEELFSMHVRKLAYVVVALAAALGVHDARANNWPPAKGADMTDPNNWPNDPGYNSDWNYWSWLPKQAAGDEALRRRRPDARRERHAHRRRLDVHDRPARREDRHHRLRHRVGRHGPRRQGVPQRRRAREPQARRTRTAAPAAAPARSPATTATATASSASRTTRTTRASRRSSPIRPTSATRARTRAAPAQPRMIGDLNENCILDAGRPHPDSFSDGVDDDNNGYTDDISGWDFYKNDNDPYDDTRYGHGTGEARDSSAAGQQRAGRHRRLPRLPLHDAARGRQLHRRRERLRQGRRLRGRQRRRRSCRRRSARSTRRRSRRRPSTTRTRKATVVVASMADENSRHHNMPGATNHTLPVHAITLRRRRQRDRREHHDDVDDVPRLQPVLELRRPEHAQRERLESARARRRARAPARRACSSRRG